MPVEISSTADAGTARRKLSDSEYDVVTMGYKLSDESGLDLLKDVADGEDNPPAIVVTAYGDEQMAMRSYELDGAPSRASASASAGSRSSRSFSTCISDSSAQGLEAGYYRLRIGRDGLYHVWVYSDVYDRGRR